ncbi:MAG: hypothetical protein GY705_07670 [Bacteroidetes bacterium]|nr:hypothetical protein [Bacteroidota bacterium]
MKCPRDNNQLIPKENDSVKFHFCKDCHGIWLQVEDFPKFLDKRRKPDISDNKQIHIDNDQDESLLCPVDGRSTMIKQNFKSIKVDICINHQGIWLDGNEVDSLVEQHRSGKFSSETADKYTAVEIFADTAYAPEIIEGLCEMFVEASETVIEIVAGIISS